MEYLQFRLARKQDTATQRAGLQETASGYGSKLTTRYVVLEGNRWRRVYCRQFSNVGSLYVIKRGEKIPVRDSDIEDGLFRWQCGASA